MDREQSIDEQIINERTIEQTAVTEQETEGAAETGLEENFMILEEIIQKMQERDVTLEESFSLYEKGMKTLKNCHQKIDAVEKKMLKMNEMGGLEEF